MEVQRLVAAGGKEWNRGHCHRVYFENAAFWYGLKCETDPKSGCITSATLDGVPITENEARDLLARLANVKIWYDLGKQEFQWRHEANIKQVVDKVVQAIEMALPPEEGPDPSRIHDYGSVFHIQASKDLDAAFKGGDQEAKARARANLALVKPRPTAPMPKRAR